MTILVLGNLNSYDGIDSYKDRSNIDEDFAGNYWFGYGGGRKTNL